jgi:protease II
MYPAAPYAAWANDSKTLFYIENNKRTLLTEKVKKHTWSERPLTVMKLFTMRKTNRTTLTWKG